MALQLKCEKPSFNSLILILPTMQEIDTKSHHIFVQQIVNYLIIQLFKRSYALFW